MYPNFQITHPIPIEVKKPFKGMLKTSHLKAHLNNETFQSKLHVNNIKVSSRINLLKKVLEHQFKSTKKITHMKHILKGYPRDLGHDCYPTKSNA